MPPVEQLGARYVTRQRKAGEIGFQRVGGVDHNFSGKRRCVLAEQRTGGVVWGGEDNGISPRDCFFVEPLIADAEVNLSRTIAVQIPLQ